MDNWHTIRIDDETYNLLIEISGKKKGLGKVIKEKVKSEIEQKLIKEIDDIENRISKLEDMYDTMILVNELKKKK